MKKRPATSLYKGRHLVTIPNLAMLALGVVGLSLFIIASTKGPSVSSVAGSFPGGLIGLNDATAATAGSKEEAARKKIRGASAIDSEPLHVIFSTSCSPFQDWQSILLFLTADMVGQEGPLTRIASGCTDEQKDKLEKIYAKLDGGRNKFRLHVTPDFSMDKATGKKYYFYNKPGGLKHWLNSPASPPDGTIIVLLDPDFVFMRPLTHKIREDGIIFSDPVKESDLIDEVTQGHPVAQMYGIGDKWIEFNLTYIAGPESPALKITSGPAWKHYSVGAPYIAHKADMQQIAHYWHDFVPRVYEGHPHLLAEMYAYSVASAHLDLPHLRLDGYMTSETEAYGEGWSLVDELPVEDYCTKDLSTVTTRIPTFLHYCQRYSVLSSSFWKRDVPDDIFSCETKPLSMPSASDVESMLSQEVPPKDLQKQKYHVFQHCQIVQKVNKAIKKYQSVFC